MDSRKNLNRRKFLGTAAATTASLSIIPSHVLGGPGRVAPSDKVTVANIGCGTQGLREMGELLQHPQIQVVAVCDPNSYTTDYMDWSPHGLRNNIRKVLGDTGWGEGIKGIAGGRMVGLEYVERFYAKNKPSGSFKGVAAYEDFREMLRREEDIDVVKIMTPDHLHAHIAIEAMGRGIDVITHKPIANRMKEGIRTIQTAEETGAITHLLAWKDRPEFDLIRSWIEAGEIGQLKEIHNWTYRPVWPQYATHPTEAMPIPEGFNWQLWLGPEQDRPYHLNYTHNVFRGWYDFGGGSVADMGHYSLFPLFEAFGFDQAPVSARAYGSTLRTSVENVPRWVQNEAAFPYACMIQLKFPAQKDWKPFDLFWYDGGMKPFTPEELEEDNRELAREGMLFVGDKGKILAGFRGEKPELIPASKMQAYAGKKDLGKVTRTPNEDFYYAQSEDGGKQWEAQGPAHCIGRGSGSQRFSSVKGPKEGRL